MNLFIDHNYRITKICDEKKDRFANMGLIKDTRVQVKHIQWLNGPIVIEVNGRLIALRRDEIGCLNLQ
jgi:Fe2+ transport system protein FeoA